MEVIIGGIPVNFPFKPYDIQKNYMSKVIDCLNSGTHGVLESPTGTGKTLSLLCSTLAWVSVQKTRLQFNKFKQGPANIADKNSLQELNTANLNSSWDGSVPKVIYSSRTHSQLIQAMNELKRTAYSFMKAVVVGSRDQLCIHPEVSKEETNSMKTQMCKLRITTHSCTFYNGMDKNKGYSEFSMHNILDIEDLIEMGAKLKVCPYFVSREIKDSADIIFMPYNYLLDPKARKANSIQLENSIIILDEAHNIEKICEESASVQIKSSDIAFGIDDITIAMKSLIGAEGNCENPEDFTIDDIALLKEMLLEFENAVDEIEIPNKEEGATYPPEFIFGLLRKAKINAENQVVLCKLLENLIQYLTALSNRRNSLYRKGLNLEKILEFLAVVFITNEELKEKVYHSFKVHINIEETKPQKCSTRKDLWIAPKAATRTKLPKIINYWCFNPGFGMEQLIRQKVRSIILTSGTLAPLKPLIAELGIPVSHHLENPHIVDKSQVYVKIIPFGPDKEPLNSNFKNRDNPKYIASLGRTILSFCPIIPGGLLIFFPSYPLMTKCRDRWQLSGIWSQISRHKPIFVEPRDKDSFNTTMNEFYSKIRDPSVKGACFMAVCRGKVSEGLDFVDINGRAVIITGLPFPPFKNPRVILKRRYLEDNRTRENELVSGEQWYSLEASRAVNQAIGRVIRHKNDYGAILLCDLRFNFPGQKLQLSAWIQGHLQSIENHRNFGLFIGELSKFFRNAEKTFPQCPMKREVTTLLNNYLPPSESMNLRIKHEPNDSPKKIKKSYTVNAWGISEYLGATGAEKTESSDTIGFMNCLNETTSVISFNNNFKNDGINSLVTIHKRQRLVSPTNEIKEKKKKIRMIGNPDVSIIPNKPSSSQTGNQSTTELSGQNENDLEASPLTTIPTNRKELLKLIKNSIAPDLYSCFLNGMINYQKSDGNKEFFNILTLIFNHPPLHYLLKAMRRFIKEADKKHFDEHLKRHFHK